MMDWTDSPCRVLHRCLTRHALLYTEMVTADAVLHGDRVRLLGFDELEHPLALQLGGSDPGKLAEAAKIAADFGYDEVNLNVGCPSDRVRSGRFGACLMREPGLVAAMRRRDAVRGHHSRHDQMPHRRGRTGSRTVPAHPDRRLRLSWCHPFSRCMPARPGCKGFRPRKTAICRRLTMIWSIASSVSAPTLTILVNGGIENLEQAEEHLRHVDGVMLGRAAYQKPVLLAEVDARFFGGEPVDVDAAVDAYADHVARQLAAGQRLHPLIKPMLGLYNGRPGARLFRRHLSEHAPRDGAGIAVLRDALGFVRERRAA